LCGGEHKISTPPLPLQILSGLRRLLIDNKCGEKKKGISVYTQQQRKTILSLWAPLASGKAGLFVKIVPKLTMAMLTF